MSSSFADMRYSNRMIAYTASAIYGAAALDGTVEGFLPGDPKFSIVPVVVVFIILVVLLAVGPRMPRWVLALLGPLGVALISDALATTPGAGDGAVLYALPVLWTTLFFGRRGAVAVIACVGVGHAIALILLPASSSYPGRWVDVMVSVCLVAVVVLALERRNELLLTRLAGEARTDALTGLLNRRGFDERASIELAHARRDGSCLAIASFDIDYFKRINDEWGHETGDQVLVRVGQLLKAECREIDLAARLGGEEFIVLLPGGDSADAYAFTERIRLALAASGPGLPTVRISAGVVASDQPASIERLLQQADSALYEAKRAGRDRTTIGSIDQTVHSFSGHNR
ncbi:MAG TPA: GGDEF domain-containing protein [Solirubrobacteraceae bacterium]|nr:GGDEF domain-containing protein [Solirubrobacteraceae bacterium]